MGSGVLRLVLPTLFIVATAILKNIGAEPLPPTASSRASTGFTGVSRTTTGFFGVSRPDDANSVASLRQLGYMSLLLGRRRASLNTATVNSRVAARSERLAIVLVGRFFFPPFLALLHITGREEHPLGCCRQPLLSWTVLCPR